MPQDYYDILGVSRDASQDEIRTAYRKLAHKYHPDKTGGDQEAEEKLKEINEAYDILKNKEKRAKYDQFGSAGPGAGFGGFDGASPFDDIFDAFFGGAGGRARGPRAMAGDDLEYPLRITLREAAFGCKKRIRFHRMETCGQCNGSGAAKGSEPEACRQCGGAGQVRMSQGFFSVTRTCPNCHGTGRIITSPCGDCSGIGTIRTERELSVELPAGVNSGSRLRVTGEGEPGRNGGPRGDLYVYVEVEADEVFERDGNDIIAEVPISFTQAVLGATIRVPSLEGEVDVKVPPATQSGTVFRLRGKGLPDIRGYRTGDQLVRVEVETPTKLSREQKDLLKRFEELSSAKTYPLRERFLERLKSTLGRA
jgi:molecular chaperone DnaJ